MVMVALVATACTLLYWPKASPRATGVLPNAVYIWQRAWNTGLEQSIAEHAADFAELLALNAEVSWRHNQPRVARVALDYPALLRSGRSVGLALRIGPYPGPFRPNDEQVRRLGDLAASLLNEAAANQLRVAELQIDFDCAESKLDGYRVWVETVRRRAAPVPVTITALPAWLKRPAFRRLLDSADGYVLQVHSLARPRDASAPFSLCDPLEARRAVERAGRLGKPFRVALPTYGYVVAFDSRGRFTGLSAEGPERLWPEGTQLREVRAEPEAMAKLVAGWRIDRPQALTGVIWYRLPLAGDTLNWSWRTLAAVMEGQIPCTDLRVDARRPQPGLVEIDLVNAGQADHVLPVRVGFNWSKARLVAADGLQGFEWADRGAGEIQFTHSQGSPRLEAGQRLTIGWVRLDREAEVQVQIQERSNPVFLK